MAQHQLRASPQTVRIGVFDAMFPPVMSIESGDTVVVQCVSGPAGRDAAGECRADGAAGTQRDHRGQSGDARGAHRDGADRRRRRRA